MAVSDVSKSLSLGQTISGRIYSGAVAPGSSVSRFARLDLKSSRQLHFLMHVLV